MGTVHGIRIEVGDLTLATTREDDLEALAALVPDDVELDPSVPQLPLQGEAERRGWVLRQTYWRALGVWAPSAWACPFTVTRAGRTVGVQWLESRVWPTAREVDSSSWLVADARGHGTGTAMRRAVLALAFGPLRASAAVSSAWEDNAASLRVSRRLGYRRTHAEAHVHGTRSGTLVHLRLERARWDASGFCDGVRLQVPDAVLPLFG